MALTFHFDLRHLRAERDLQVSVHGKTISLETHREGTLRTARDSHPALSTLPADAARLFTHFAEVDESLFPRDNVGWIRLERPRKPGVHLAQCLMVGAHIPAAYLRAYYEEAIELYSRPLRHLQAFMRPSLKARPRLLSAKMAALGVKSAPGALATLLDSMVAAQGLLTIRDSGTSLISHHPELANSQPYTAAVVMNEHIDPSPELDPEQFNLMQILADAISENPDWSEPIPCTDLQGKPVVAEYAIDGLEPGQQLYTYTVAAPVLEAAALPTAGAMRTANDDNRLRNRTWTPSTGTTVVKRDATAALRSAAKKEEKKTPQGKAGVSYKWTVNLKTERHGIQVDANSIKVDDKDNFSVETYNRYLRTVYAGYQLANDQGKLQGDITKLGQITAVNTVLGIPTPTDPEKLSFALNGNAAVHLYFGSAGVGERIPEVTDPGLLFTCLWQYGVPTIFIIAGKAITSTETFNKIVADKKMIATILGILSPQIAALLGGASAIVGTKKVMSSFANFVLGIAVQKGCEAFGQYLIKEAGEGAISSAFGPVGWVFRLVAVGLNVENMLITTGQVLSSPGSLTVKCSRAIDVKLQMQPDPAHGEAGKPSTAIWPAIATNYIALLQSRDGTNMELKGTFPKTSSSEPKDLFWESVPAGGDFRIIFGCYSASGWLAGHWQSDWVKSKPNQGTTLDLGKAQIEENLVPLSPSTQYVFKQKVAYEKENFVWTADNPPAAPRTALECGGAGKLCDIVGITINNSAFQVGYAWRSSGQGLHPNQESARVSNDQLYAVQNLSVLEKPGSRLKSSSIGFTDRPAIAYAPSLNKPKQIDQTNFVLDPRGGGMHLRQVVLDGSKDFGFDGKQKSWGRFPIESVDALVVHPSNSVIAASYRNHKLMILQLPEAPVDDGKAPEAILVSGQGVREGLMKGPRALTVTPDGRILVLEADNRRVQAFDTQGNPVPSFTPQPELFSMTTSEIATDLNKGKVPESFVKTLIANEIGVEAKIRNDADTDVAVLIARLDKAKFTPPHDPLIAALSRHGVDLAYDPAKLDDPKVSAQITVVTKGKSWTLTDPRKRAWQVVKGKDEERQEDILKVFWLPFDTEVRVEKPGSEWLLLDRLAGNAWRLRPSTADAKQTLAQRAVSFFPLRAMRVGAYTFQDMAVEAQGYIYVIGYQGDGSKAEDYILDIYTPDGEFMSRTPDPSVTRNPQNVVAGRIAVDIWRNLFGLTFEVLRGPKNAPQPGLAQWMPTPPIFSMAAKIQKDLNDRNIGVIQQEFQKRGITLSNQAFIVVKNREGAWEVKDGDTIYHIYRSGGDLQVYPVPA